MNKLIGLLFAGCCLVSSLARADDLSPKAPAYPPDDWGLTVGIRLSESYVNKMMGIAKPGKDANRATWAKYREERDALKCDMFQGDIDINLGRGFVAIFTESPGALSGNDSNPLVNTNAPKDEFRMHYEEPQLGFMVVHDQKLVYEAAVRAIEGFRFSLNNHSSSEDSEDIAIRLDVFINGDSVSLSYTHIAPMESVPEHAQEVLALLQRNLPDRYAPLFNLFKIQDIPPLTADQKGEYGRCPVHNENLIPGTVKKTSGGWNHTYAQLEKKDFPKANLAIDVGWCGTGHGIDCDQLILYCPKCRGKREAWLKSVKDINEYKADWAKSKKQKDHNNAIGSDEE